MQRRGAIGWQLIRWVSIVPALLLAFWVAAIPRPAAALTCSATQTDVNFGSIDVTQNATFAASGTLTVSCTGGYTSGATVIACTGYGGGQGGISPLGQPRYMANGANQLAFEIYKDAGHTTVWGSLWAGSGGTPNEIDITLNGSGSGSGTATAYGLVSTGQQTMPPATYLSAFIANDVNFQYGYSGTGNCQGGFQYYTVPTFNVTAAVVSSCTISATNMNFGSKGLLNSDTDATSTLTVKCSQGTTYDVGLNQGTAGSSVTARKMSLSANALPYFLYRDGSRSLNWGNTVGQDTVNRTGTGSNQSLTVYGRVPTQIPTPAPGTYTDTIVATVTY